MEAKLIVISGKANKTDVSLKLPSTIGRSKEADLTIAHPMVSRQHCELYEAEGVLMVRDLGSLNGTYINGQRVSEGRLDPNMEVTVGPLTFRVAYQTPAGSGAGAGTTMPALGSADFTLATQQADVPTVPTANPPASATADLSEALQGSPAAAGATTAELEATTFFEPVADNAPPAPLPSSEPIFNVQSDEARADGAAETDQPAEPAEAEEEAAGEATPKKKGWWNRKGKEKPAAKPAPRAKAPAPRAKAPAPKAPPPAAKPTPPAGTQHSAEDDLAFEALLGKEPSDDAENQALDFLNDSE